MNAENLRNGQEQYDTYYSHVMRKELIQYEYRHIDGDLFSCVAPTLEACIQKRTQWLNRKLFS